MNVFSTLIQALRANPWHAFPFAAIAGAGLLDLRLPATSHAGAALHLLQAAAFFMLYLSSSTSTRLAQTAHILAQRRVPDALWKDAVTRQMTGVGINGLALLAALAVCRAVSDERHIAILAGLATLSLAACAGTLFSTLRSGLLPRQHNRTAYSVALVASATFFAYGDVALSALIQWHAAALVLLALSWPVLSVALQRYWRIMPTLQPPAQMAETSAWTTLVLRYTVLQPSFLQDNNLQSSVLGGLRMGTAALGWSLMPPLPLGGILTAGHLLAIIPWIPAAMTMVAIRDLHWRTVLAPAASGAPSLALRIYRTSVKLAVFLLLVMMLGQALLDAILGSGMAGILNNMEKWVVFGMQAPLLVAVSVLLCALPHPRRTMWGVFLAAFLALAVTHVGDLYSVPVEGLQAGPVYMAGIAVLSGLVMLIANRLWTKNKLLPYLPTRPVSITAFSAAR